MPVTEHTGQRTITVDERQWLETHEKMKVLDTHNDLLRQRVDELQERVKQSEGDVAHWHATIDRLLGETTMLALGFVIGWLVVGGVS